MGAGACGLQSPSDVLLKKDFPKIDDWESGLKTPTYRQLEKLAEILKVPVAAFFFPAPPNVEPKSTFRTLPSEQFEKIPPKIRLLLRKAKHFNLGLSELNDGRNPCRAFDHTRSAPYATMNLLRLPLLAFVILLVFRWQDQFGWKNDEDTALKAWRSAFYRVGVTVFKDAFGADEYCGFSLHDDGISRHLRITIIPTQRRGRYSRCFMSWRICFFVLAAWTKLRPFGSRSLLTSRISRQLAIAWLLKYLVPEHALNQVNALI